ncbi:MAG: heavy metal translocating P-type ATPase [Gemmatimonadota bacterium]
MSTITSVESAPGTSGDPRRIEAGVLPVVCAHCFLPVPVGWIEPESDTSFCCAGCRTAYTILHESGLGHYYDLAGRRASPVPLSGRSYAEFDHPAFQSRYVTTTAQSLSRVELLLEGVHCASCIWLVERIPLLLPGVARAELEIGRSLATIEWDAGSVALSDVARTLASLGYPPHPFLGVRRDAVRRQEERTALVRIGVAGAIAINVMLAALAMYSGLFGSGMEADYTRFFRYVSLGLTIPAVLFPGRVFFAGAWAALRTRTLHLDLPVALALGAGFVRGTVNTIADSGPVYFDGVTLLIFLLLVGRYLQQRGTRAATDASELLLSLTPHGARIVDDAGTLRELPASALLPGMTLDVRAGEVLAADGSVAEGRSSIDLSLLTGESHPVAVQAGDLVYAGTRNCSAPLRIRVARAGDESRVARLLRQVEESALRRAPIVRLANRLAGWFVGVVLLLAVVTYLWRSTVDPHAALDGAIALLIVTCPCALAMATPLAVTVAIGGAARHGLLIRGGDAIEALSRPGIILLDKTGTVTESRVALVRWDGAEWAKPLVLALERDSTHPLADGFRRGLAPTTPPTPRTPPTSPAGTTHDAGAAVTDPHCDDDCVVESSSHVVGAGIVGRVSGRDVVVGSPPFVARHLTSPAAEGNSDASSDALTPVWIGVDGFLVARAYLGDPIRADAVSSVAALQRAGWEIRLLSGDAESVVQSVGRDLGLSPDACRASATPEEKLRLVEELARTHRVVMVGDGVNDAAAIAAATVGVGVHGGAEASLTVADVFLTTPGLTPLVALVRGADRTMRVIRRNIAFSLLYNIVGASLAIGGFISPLVAAVMMPISSLTVVLGSWYGTSFEDA